MDILDKFIGGLFTLERWPFWSAVLVFTIIGQFMSKSFFTRFRAYAAYPNVWEKHFWYWGRETLTLHPLFAGALLGTLWMDPENAHWTRIASAMYFATAGAVSLFAWTLIKAFAKRRGVDLSLPGDSSIPPSPPGPPQGEQT